MLSPPAREETPLPTRIDSVVIGASAGAIEALGELLPLLPRGTPWPVVVVVHMPPGKPSLLVPIFARKCALPVREPEDKQSIKPGIWFAPPDYHLLIEGDRTFALSIDPLVNYSRPSIDVLFESAADAYGPALVSIVLTGANEDGAKGARAVRDAGGFVIVQEPTTAEAPRMPQAAIDRASPQRVANVAEIGRALRDAAAGSPP